MGALLGTSDEANSVSKKVIGIPSDYLKNIAHKIQGRTICAFGEACAWPVLSFVDKFRDKFDERGAEDEARLAESQMKEGVN